MARGFFRLWNKADSISRQRQRFLLSQKPKLLSETAMMAMFFFCQVGWCRFYFSSIEIFSSDSSTKKTTDTMRCVPKWSRADMTFETVALFSFYKDSYEQLLRRFRVLRQTIAYECRSTFLQPIKWLVGLTIEGFSVQNGNKQRRFFFVKGTVGFGLT